MLDQIFKPKTVKGNTDDFLNEDAAMSNKRKSDEVMKKYCTLYNDDQDEFHIKPLNQDFLDKKKRQQDNLNSTGKEWFDMKVPELTPEVKEDLLAMQLKKYIDPTQFAKKNDRKGIPKFFQIGRINDMITDGKRNRLRKDEVRSRIAEEILDYDTAKKYSLRKFEEIQKQKRKIGLKKAKINKYKMKSSKKSGMIVK